MTAIRRTSSLRFRGRSAGFVSRLGIYLFLAALISSGTALAQRTLYVTTNGASESPYTNWAIAATSIMDAVTVATNGETVLVSNGVYRLTNHIDIAKGIVVSSVNGWASTIVDGNNYVGKPVTNRCFYVRNALAVVIGFSVTNGCGVGSSESYTTQGGGISIFSGMIRNCFVAGNYSYYGGGVYMEGGTLADCTVASNRGISGGGLYIKTAATVTNCTISNNNASTGGGGMLMVAGTASWCTVTGNAVTNGSGGGVYFNGRAMFRDGVISHNTASSYGGGVSCRGGPYLTRCQLANNIASGEGGGVYIKDNGAWLWHCTIVSNRTGTTGGGIHMDTAGGTVTTMVYNCLIATNLAKTAGGGIFADFVNTRTGYFGNCTIAGNAATNAGADGGGVCLSRPTLWLTNMIVCGNTAADQGADVYSNPTANNTNAFSYSCLGSTNGFIGPGNIAADPLFLDAATLNFRFGRNSPCVNAGLNQDWMNGAADSDGMNRLDRLFHRVDMGAYEYVFPGTFIAVR